MNTPSSPHFPDSFYRVTAKGLYVKDEKVMLVHDFTGRSDTDPSPEWELPGGGVDFEEGLADTLKREVQEEMSLKIKWVEELPTYVWTTKHGSGRGMEWYYVLTLIFRFEPEDLDFTPSRECREIRFFSKEELNQNISELASQVVPLAERYNPADFPDRE